MVVGVEKIAKVLFVLFGSNSQADRTFNYLPSFKLLLPRNKKIKIFKSNKRVSKAIKFFQSEDLYDQFEELFQF